MNITCLPSATKPHKRKSLMILIVSTANFEPWSRSGDTAPVFLNFRLLCKSVVTRHTQDNLGRCNESPVPTEYHVSCAPITVSHFVPLFLNLFLLSIFSLLFLHFLVLHSFTCTPCLLYFFHIFYLFYCVTFCTSFIAVIRYSFFC
jgi:hypothetical protein